jgi:hypothetical protein
VNLPTNEELVGAAGNTRILSLYDCRSDSFSAERCTPWYSNTPFVLLVNPFG